MHISVIHEEDYSAIVALVNAAYRGEASKQGWTTEANLIAGDKRVDEKSLAENLRQPGAVVLKLNDENGLLLGCVFLHHTEFGLYLGMLSVWPGLQAKGIGKMLMRAAEEHAHRVGAQRIYMNVISIRTELISWYQRLGFRNTEETKPFPDTPAFGVPVIPLEFIVMEKYL
jgi:predicted N-acetyltransferase YhbS